MTLQLVYNTTDTVALVDDGGRTIGGREWGPVETTEPAAKRLLEVGDLVLADEDSAREANIPAVDALDERRERKDKAKKLALDELREVTGDEDGTKAELVSEVAADSTVVIPSPTPAKPKSTGRAASGEK